MHPQQLQEIRSGIRRLMYYMEQFGVPHQDWADEIEKKIILQPDHVSDSEYFAFKAEVRQLIVEMVAEET